MATNSTPLEMGVQFHLPTYADVPLPHLVHLAKQAVDRGVAQIFWVTDNLRSRNTFVTLAALACQVPAKLAGRVVHGFHLPGVQNQESE